MKIRLKHVITGIVFAFSPIVMGQGQGNPNEEIHKIRVYLQNLGLYFGYDLTQFCPPGSDCPSSGAGASAAGNGTSPQGITNTLIDKNIAYAAELNVYYTYLGALLGGNSSQNPNPIVPNNIASNNYLSRYATLNALAGQSYSKPTPYSTESAQTVSVTSLIDQRTYQSDPVSQAILNIIATPNSTFCTANRTQGFGKCPFLTRESVIEGVIGPIPETNKVFTVEANAPLIPQLNPNTLLMPLLYTTNTGSNANNVSAGASDPNPGSSNATPSNTNTGLIANTQAQQAENFIRYATSSVTPLSLLDWGTYDSLLSTALNYNGRTPADQQAQAKAKLTTYLTKLRSYAAQSSVAVSNLYYILSKRMPQSPTNEANNQSSQALSEYIMASWRLFTPGTGDGNNSTQKQWLEQINQASSATVQKEIAILLAEMNYQLYLMRQQQERLLLTNSMLLLQSTMQNSPDNTTVAASQDESQGKSTQ